jgi:hypothetical protein
MRSELGSGSVFTVRLPNLEVPPAHSAPAPPAALSVPEKRMKGRRRASRRGAKPVEPTEPPNPEA